MVHFLFEVHPGFPLPVGSLHLVLFLLDYFLVIHFLSAQILACPTSCWFTTCFRSPTSCWFTFFQLPVGSLPVSPISCWFTSYQPHRTLPVSSLPASPLPFRPLPVSYHFPAVREGGVCVCVRHPPDQSETFWSTI